MKRFVVIGLGNFGYYVAKALYESNHEVIAIDSNKDRIQAVQAFSTTAIVQDATDAEALKSLGLKEADAVIVSTGANIKYSILICYHLSEMGVQRIVVKAEDDVHGEILKRLGASDIIRPGMDMAQRLAMRLTSPNVLDFLPLGEDYTIVEVEPPPPFVGKSLQELQLRSRYEVYIIAVKEAAKDKLIIVPPADYVVHGSHILIMLGKEKDIMKIKELQ